MRWGSVLQKGRPRPVPNFLADQVLAKALCIEGRFLESQGRYEDALKDYMTALTMGRDFSLPGNVPFSHMISAAIDSISLHQIRRLIASGKLTRGLFGAVFGAPSTD